jgi:hypothetical protein
MEPLPKPPPINPNPGEPTPGTFADLPIHNPFQLAVFRLIFPIPEPIRAVPEDYFSSQKEFHSYIE